MPRLLKKQFLAEINICDATAIVRNITIIGNGMNSRTAKLRALARMKELREEIDGRTASLHPVAAIYMNGEISSAPASTKIQTQIDYHEYFHEKVEKRGIRNSQDRVDISEESGAHAVEITMPVKNKHQQNELEMNIRHNTMLARHSVRFMFALHTGKADGLVSTSMGILRRETAIIAGDSFSAALNATKNYLLYLECFAVLRCMGTNEGKEAIFEAIRTERTESLHQARRFLVSQLPKAERKKLDEVYGIDLRKFRFRSPYHSNAVTEEWMLE